METLQPLPCVFISKLDLVVFFLIDLSFFVENQILNKLDTVLSSQHLSSSIVVETKSVGLATSEESVQEPTTRPEWRPKSLKVGYGLLNVVIK